MTESNIMQTYAEAGEAALDNFRENIRDFKARIVTQPLGGKRRSKDEQRSHYFALSRDPMQLSSEYDFLSDRYLDLQERPEHVIPRRLWDSMKKGKREFEEEVE